MHFHNLSITNTRGGNQVVFLIAGLSLWHEVSPAFPHWKHQVDFPECPPAELARFLARKSVSGDAQHLGFLGSGVMTRWVSSGSWGNGFFLLWTWVFWRVFTIGRELFTPFLCLFHLYVLTYDLFETLNESTTPRKASKLIAAYLEWRKGISKWPCLGWTSSKKPSFICKITFFQLIWPCF